jgi:hypothetical protein
MSTLDARCLEAIPGWLKSLPEDAVKLAGVLEQSAAGPTALRSIAISLNYLFKSLDLIPDGLEDLGFIDDAFVLRVAASLVAGEDRDADGLIGKFAEDAALIREFLGPDYDRLELYVQQLEHQSARGRSIPGIVSDSAVRAELVREVATWAVGYTCPSFARDARSLVKLKSFLATRLGAVAT